MCFICTHIAFCNFSGQLRETASCLPSHPTSQTSCRLPLRRTCSCLALLDKVSVPPSPVCINRLRSRLYHGPHGGTLEGPLILHPGSNSLSKPFGMSVYFLILCLHPCLFAGTYHWDCRRSLTRRGQCMVMPACLLPHPWHLRFGNVIPIGVFWLLCNFLDSLGEHLLDTFFFLESSLKSLFTELSFLSLPHTI